MSIVTRSRPAIDLPLTKHARVRGAQRRISQAQLALVLDYGQAWHARNAIHFFFGRWEARWHRERLGADVAHLEGITVVTSLTGTIFTTYRDDGGPKRRRKRCHL